MPYVRTVKTASGATAVQIVYSSRRGSREIEHIGSAHDDAELELLKAAARQRLAAGQGELDLGLDAGGAGRAAADHLLADGLPAGRAGARLPGAGVRAARRAGTRCSAQLVLARIIEPASKLDSAAGAGGGRGRAGVVPRRVKRRLPAYAKEAWRQQLSAACAAHAGLGPASLVLYDVSTLVLRDRRRATGSARPGSPRSGGWSRRSPSACSPTQDGFPLMV